MDGVGANRGRGRIDQAQEGRHDHQCWCMLYLVPFVGSNSPAWINLDLLYIHLKTVSLSVAACWCYICIFLLEFEPFYKEQLILLLVNIFC